MRDIYTFFEVITSLMKSIRWEMRKKLENARNELIMFVEG